MCEPLLPEAAAEARPLGCSSQLKAEKLTLPTERVGLYALARDVTSLVRHMVRGKPVEMHFVAPPDMSVLGSEIHLKQVLLNLLINACKHTEVGSVTVSIEEVPSDAEPAVPHRTTGRPSSLPLPPPPPPDVASWRPVVWQRIRFKVADTGSGVPIRVRETIFDAFEMGPVSSRATSRVQAGTGLGLPLSKALVEKMGGAIQLRCREHGGSEFSFELHMVVVPAGARGDEMTSAALEAYPPELAVAAGGTVAGRTAAAAAMAATPKSCASSLPTHPPLPSKLRILIADDQRLNQKMLERRLGNLLDSPLFTFAETAEKALMLLTHGNFDVAILDELYGNDEGAMTGLQLTRAIRAAGLRCARGGGDLPLIGSTGNASDEAHLAAALAAGQLTVWGKPAPAPQQMANDLQRALVSGE